MTRSVGVPTQRQEVLIGDGRCLAGPAHGWPVMAERKEHGPDEYVGEADVSPELAQRPRWLSELEHTATRLWAEATDTRVPGWPPVWLRLVAAAAAALVVLVLVVAVIRGIAEALTQASAGAVRAVSGAQIMGALADPVRTWLSNHTTGLAITSAQVWWVWIAAGAVFFILATCGTVGGRVGWILFGASTAAMTYAGTPGSGGATAAGLVTGAWAVLSVPALHRRRGAGPHVVYEPVPPGDIVPGPARDVSLTSTTDLPRGARGDVASIAADIYEGLLRRWAVRDQHVGGHPRRAWTVTSGPGQGFRARDETGQEAAGIALSSEAVVEVLAGLSRPPGVRPVVRWTGELPSAPDSCALRWQDHQSPDGAMGDFLKADPSELTQLAQHLLQIREDWASAMLPARIKSRAAILNKTHPLVSEGLLQPQDDEPLGQVTAYGWIDPATVVAGNAQTWNDFADHRPDQVRMIIDKLLTDPDPAAAARFVLAHDGIAQVQRVNGPVGPLHAVTVNGTHRTHALRILEAPLMAAEITVDPLPLHLTGFDVQDPEATAYEDVTALWRGLLTRGLIAGVVSGHDEFPHLELHHTSAAWMLLTADRAAAVSRAYERIYPGALAGLGIPGQAISTGRSWRNWLR